MVRSPQRKDGNGQALEEHQARTSRSCPLLFAYFYKQLEATIALKQPALLPELQLTWAMTERAAALVEAEAAQVEPIQLLRYEEGEFYRQHHDHTGYYQSQRTEVAAESHGESRPCTVLVFLNDVMSGGELSFPALGLAFSPRKGDAVVWSNVDAATGEADPLMVHEALPPGAGEVKLAANIWVRDVPFTSPNLASAYKT